MCAAECDSPKVLRPRRVHDEFLEFLVRLPERDHEAGRLLEDLLRQEGRPHQQDPVELEHHQVDAQLRGSRTILAYAGRAFRQRVAFRPERWFSAPGQLLL